MPNPVSKIFDLNRPFTFFHTHVIDRTVMDAAIAAGKSLEIDISVDPGGSIYVGHPLVHYEVNHLPPPNNLPLEQIVAESKQANLFLVFDCKDVRVLPTVRRIVQEYGADNCVLHSFAQELSFKPWPPKVLAKAEPSWGGEELPLQEMLKLKRATGAPLILTCHGMTLTRLEKEEAQIIEQVLAVAAKDVEIISFFLSIIDEILPLSIAGKLIDRGILPVVNVDHTPPEARPEVFFGSTDVLGFASDPSNFR